jgi:excisionase family DNA binding protein
MEAAMDLKDYVKVTDAASELDVTPRQIRKLIGQGVLRAESLGPRLYLVERTSVNRYKAERRGPGRPSKQETTGGAYSYRRKSHTDTVADR